MSALRPARVQGLFSGSATLTVDSNEKTVKETFLTLPLEPSSKRSFLRWEFAFYIGERNFEGFVFGKAEVLSGESIECVFQVGRKTTREHAEAQLLEECIAYVTEKGGVA